MMHISLPSSKSKCPFPYAYPTNWYGPSQFKIKAFFFPGFCILTIVSSTTKPSKVCLPFLVAYVFFYFFCTCSTLSKTFSCMLVINFIFIRNCAATTSTSTLSSIIVVKESTLRCGYNHKGRKLSTSLNPAPIPKHDLGQLFIPTVYVFWCCREYGDAMFDSFD